MPSNDLNEAIQLIQQGQPAQAQPILQALIKANPQDLAAWSWYVKSCPSPEQRLKALEMCLKFNPGNPQVLDAIQKVQAKLSVAPAAALTTIPASSTTSMNQYAAVAVAIPSTAGSEEEVVDSQRRFMGLDETLGRPFLWYDVWLRALTQANVDSYTALLRDPLATPGRAYWWVFLAGLVTGLVSLLNPSLLAAVNEIEHMKGVANFGNIAAILFVVFVPVGAAFSILWLMIEAAIYDLLAKLLGGTGNFSRTVYLMGAYTAPLSIVTGILAIIPLVNCLAALLGFYSFWLNATSIQAAHRLNGGRAYIVVLIPTLVILMIVCIAFIVGGQALLQALPRRSA